MRSVAAISLTLLGAAGVAACGGETSGQRSTFVGGQVCAECHQSEFGKWLGSHHDLAMQLATDSTVLGDFDGGTLRYFGRTSTFFERDGKFFIRTDGPDGSLDDYEIAYTFGVSPLQQYLVAFPDGWLQALTTAWDSRPSEAGGQRWFHLYPDENIAHDDILHWTRRNQNWNYMCAECHSTNLEKNYEPMENRFETTWSEINVSCEACHGPGSRHVAWAREGAHRDELAYSDRGLAVHLKEARGTWIFEDGAEIARRASPVEWNSQVETCGRCHARRDGITEDYLHGQPLLDTHRPVTLAEGLYYPDGQILDEVYVYGSFVQSRMYSAGVTCSDCHEPHGLGLRASGNDLCSQCHLPATFDTPSHHFHPEGSPGASCVECHMPARTYMVVDDRRDHSFRVPRPDLSVTIGVPNACTPCHATRTADWAARTVARWYSQGRSSERHFGEVFAAARRGDPRVGQELAALVTDTVHAGIVRATALSLLAGYGGPVSIQGIQQGLTDADPLVRMSAARAARVIEPGIRLRATLPLLSDSARTVRIEAARALASVPSGVMSPSQREALEQGVSEVVEALLTNAERPESHLNLGAFYTDLGRLADARSAYRVALRLDSAFVPALVNLAEVLRLEGRDADGEALLQRALVINPDDAIANHALGLLLVRLSRHSEALRLLGRAAELAPDNARMGYVYAVALNSSGESEQAVAVLEAALTNHPFHRGILGALITMNRDRGDLSSAVRHARRLVELWPSDQNARQLLAELEGGGLRGPGVP